MKIEKIGSCHGTNFVIIAVTRGCRYEHLIVPRHDDVIKWKHFPLYWPFVRGIYRSSVNSPHKGQCRGALMFLWSAPWINGWMNYRQAGDLRRHRTHYDVIVMCKAIVSIMATIAGMAHRSDWLSEDQFIKRQTRIRIRGQRGGCRCPGIEWVSGHLQFHFHGKMFGSCYNAVRDYTLVYIAPQTRRIFNLLRNQYPAFSD